MFTITEKSIPVTAYFCVEIMPKFYISTKNVGLVFFWPTPTAPDQILLRDKDSHSEIKNSTGLEAMRIS